MEQIVEIQIVGSQMLRRRVHRIARRMKPEPAFLTARFSNSASCRVKILIDEQTRPASLDQQLPCAERRPLTDAA
jgi:hypothetical protein